MRKMHFGFVNTTGKKYEPHINLYVPGPHASFNSAAVAMSANKSYAHDL